MKRRDDWLVRLTAVLGKYDQGVDPDDINCATFAGEAVEAMTGEDPMAKFKGTIEEQMVTLKILGFTDPVEYLGSIMEEVGKNFASVGDVAVFKGTSNLPAFGVVIGDYAKVIRPDGQPGLMPVSKAQKVFKL